MNKKVIVIDLCGTLVSSNTRNDFIHWYHRRNHFVRLLNLGLLSLRRLKIIGTETFDNLLLKSVRKVDAKQMCEAAKIFVDEIILHKLNHNVLNLVREYQRDADVTVCVVSASLDFIVKEFAERLDFEYLATATSLRSGRIICNTPCNGINKVHEIERRYGQRAYITLAIGNSLGDLEMLRRSNERRVFVGRPDASLGAKLKDIGVDYLFER